MKIKKTLLLLLTVLPFVFCKEEVLIEQNKTAIDVTLNLRIYDNTYLSIHKIFFTIQKQTAEIFPSRKWLVIAEQRYKKAVVHIGGSITDKLAGTPYS